jgi:hypothetical protein
MLLPANRPGLVFQEIFPPDQGEGTGETFALLFRAFA